MNQMVRFGIVLGIICLAATLVLALTYEITKPKIDEQMRMEEQRALKVVIPEADSFEAKTIDDITYFDALKDGELVGYCVNARAVGYGGGIRLVVGITPDGIIKGIEVLQHQETPGLGSKIKEIRPGESEPYFLKQFKGKEASTVVVRKNIDAITGATISSKAVTDAVRTTVDEFLEKVGS
jgi:electron transport complex protein RnfG